MTKEQKVEAATLHSAMALAFAEIEDAKKDSTNPHFKAKFASLNSVIDAIKPHLVPHGLWFSQSTYPQERGVSVETFIHHANGDSMGCGKLFVPANKQDAQGFGSALTYARRYSLQTAFGIGAEDDDGNAASQSAPRQEPEAQGYVSEEQWHELQDKVNAVGADIAAFCKWFKVGSPKTVPAARFDEAMKALDAKAKKAVENA